ncbi:MAG TPA: class I SAM-dependent methyltransferase [Anaerolineae bacterium]|nr:class I SAM-dependent methyltransferase [Anaerolineae bacterium]HOQ97186.1 class I SAM-dependent methyltransferase [Anaerolineae bacterium]HPL29133.1 class I SAM-dependent methyltransferase [Anaerolineae bacterium]
MTGETDKTIELGHPSYVWRFGQNRRFELIRQAARLEGARILDVGCGLGLYVRQFRTLSDDVWGVDVDEEKVAEASQTLPNIQRAPAEALPFADGTFDTVLSHEVLEHVDDDRQAVHEAYRVLKGGGRLVVFVPNRWYPFETHGAFWGGRYHFGNIPLVNYMPNRLRARFCPHVRAYRARELRRLFDGLPGRIVVHTQIYPGYDKIAARHGALAGLFRGLTYMLEHTPLRHLGLSHLLVFEKAR